jgi:DNA-directed RNA polymerase specialized sigma24 family protein
MTEIDWEALEPLAEKVAREIAGKWQIVEADDVKQEILLHAYSEKHLIAEYQGNTEILRKVFWNAGRRYAAKERAYLDLMDDQYFYTPDEVRGVMRSFIYTDAEVSEQIGKKDDLTRCVITDNILSARLDAEKGIKRLNRDYQEVIMRLFVYGLTADNETDRKRGYRAIDALTAEMNRNIRTGR